MTGGNSLDAKSRSKSLCLYYVLVLSRWIVLIWFVLYDSKPIGYQYISVIPFEPNHMPLHPTWGGRVTEVSQ